MTTSISVVGTIATEPKLITPASGSTLCSFRLASDERWFDKDKQEWVDGNTNWFGVIAFRSLGAHASESFHQGDRVIVSGRLRMRAWEKDDRRGIAVEIEADAIGHDVRWGVSKFEKRVGQKTESSKTPLAEDAKLTNDAPEQTPGEPSTSPQSVGWPAAA